MKSIVKALDMKFKSLEVISRDYEAILQKYNRRAIYPKGKRHFIESGRNIRFEDQGYKTQECSKRKPRGY